MTVSTTETSALSTRLLHLLESFQQVTVVMHDNPDPDAIATGWAIHCLIEERLQMPVRLVAGGAIVRAENKHMVELLSPPVELISTLADDPYTATILVDCSIGTTNHLVTRSGIHPTAVIDHHLLRHDQNDAEFIDIRSDVAASASIAASYLSEQQVDPGAKLATAILYAIRTETCGYETNYSELDRSVVAWMTKVAELELLAEIDNAPLDRDYFGDLTLAMQSTFVYADTGFCFLPRAEGVEIVGEVADLLVRCRAIRRVLCAAMIGKDLVLSTRTQRNAGNASELLQQTLDGIGGCGGHAHRAGGKVPNVGFGEGVHDILREDLRDRWLRSCGVEQEACSRLIAPRDIVENL